MASRAATTRSDGLTRTVRTPRLLQRPQCRSSLEPQVWPTGGHGQSNRYCSEPVADNFVSGALIYTSGSVCHHARRQRVRPDVGRYGGIRLQTTWVSTQRLIASGTATLFPADWWPSSWRMVNPAPRCRPPSRSPSRCGAEGQCNGCGTFLEQVSWGPDPASLARVQQLGFEAYLDEQFAQSPSRTPITRRSHELKPVQHRFVRMRSAAPTSCGNAWRSRLGRSSSSRASRRSRRRCSCPVAAAAQCARVRQLRRRCSRESHAEPDDGPLSRSWRTTRRRAPTRARPRTRTTRASCCSSSRSARIG